ncbi:hypothetical protein APHAL10511_006067 [Amanita phalloides]|nr:hypothetical protein APHAL10511_006067 [Amanita phalloides]
MATRRRIGVSIASTEAARRQLMQPVSCWERTWVTPENVSNISFKVRKWVRTDRPQQFSDDEGGADEPLAPLPDEPEVVDGDEELEQDEQPTNGMESAPPGTRAATAPQEDTQPSSPKPQLLLGSSNDTVIDTPMDGLDASLNPLNTTDGKVTGEEDGMDLDLSGLPLQDPHDLTASSLVVVGPLMDPSDDPLFAQSTAPLISE